ncbi:arylsulfatase B-like [Bombyx mandarina]|uniref:Arylsulfatase B-like n=1 Tax=Bombyx mandarina TaxID=7092 RepID=A0A6J2JMR1_BOMMA|nr:arylsulfatase B-like [Bombyx mandarina]
MFFTFLFIIGTLILNTLSEDIVKPNIVFIVADDLGWDDVSIHGSDQIMTPNIDIMGYEGTILHQYYTDSLGTASRSALFTGKYAIRLGTHGSSIAATEDGGVPLSERLLPSYLQDAGYTTHLLGKWQLGHSRKSYLPTSRGFDTFYGFVTGSVDYYTYSHVESFNGSAFFGLDLFENTHPVDNQTGHLTDIITDQAIQIIRNHDINKPLYLHVCHAAPHAGGGLVHLQTPEDTINANDHIAHSARRLYAGMVTGLDRSIGNIIAALAEREILDNTLIIFVSDNGAAPVGATQNFGSNLPLRGTKGRPWEGAIRSIAIVWHASITPQIWNGLFHVTDWLPTLVAAAGGKAPTGIDGVNQWNALTKDEDSSRKRLLLTVDDLNGWAAYRDGDFKIIIGDVDKETSVYLGNEFKELRLPVHLYESTLLSSEAAHVFKEILDLYLDLDEIFHKRDKLSLRSKHNISQEFNFCVPTRESGCLFNITADPLETTNLWSSLPDVVRRMVLRLRYYWAQINPRCLVKIDKKSDPSLRDFVWSPWLEDNEQVAKPIRDRPRFPLKVLVGELQYLIDSKFNNFSETMSAYVKSMADSFLENVSELFSF